MRRKTFEEKFLFGEINCFGIGTHRTKEWIIEKISFVGINGQEITVILDCVHVEDSNM